jgi:hypothetical protein
MEWSASALFDKSRLYMERAYQQPLDSELFALWTSLALELLCRAALAKIHPVLLADPREDGNLLYAFGIEPATPPKSIVTKAIVIRCTRLIEGFTDDMAKHCALMASKRNGELHSGVVGFDNVDNALWLPATYEVMEILLKHLGSDFHDFLGGENGQVATEMLRDRRASLRKEIFDRINACRTIFEGLSDADRSERAEAARIAQAAVARNQLIRQVHCPACGSPAVMAGVIASRGPVTIDEADTTISREVRVLPTQFRCRHCDLRLQGYQEMRLASLGTVYTVSEQEDPVEFFGIDPADYIDAEEFVREYMAPEYDNE